MQFQVSELAKRTGLNKDTIRYYVKIGLLTPIRDNRNGYKLFDEKDIVRLRFICKAKYLGFTLKEIKQLMDECNRGINPGPMAREFLRRHIESNKKQLQKCLQLQQRMEQAWQKWLDMPDTQAKVEGYCQMIEIIVSDELAMESADDHCNQHFLVP